MTNSAGVESTLKKVFGFDGFRPNQEKLVSGVLEGCDVFGVMPTGGGKSLCYQLPAVILEGCAVVVSPLIALMKDQVDSAKALGIRAACITSHSTPEERKESYRRYRTGDLDLLYVAPERLALPAFRQALSNNPQGRPSFFAIDEAHCISEWGHDFRPDYRTLTTLKREFVGVPVVAFTATSTAQVSEDILQQLELVDPVAVRASFDRKNLFYEIRSRTDGDRQLLEFIQSQPEGASGVIYRTTRKAVEETARLLVANGLNAQAYHAGMEPHERTQIQDDFIKDNTPLIVATVAFGMGIDKPDVRFVVHYDMPKTIEGYYQETGRAGRDGDPSHCLMLYSPGDVVKQGYLIDLSEDEDEKKRGWRLLRQMNTFASQARCRRVGLLDYFGEKYENENCEGCDVCAGSFKQEDATRDARIMLSAVARTKGRFGAVHLCDIVTGAKTKKIKDFNHAELKTYGAGQGKPKKYWRHIIDGLLVDGCLVLSQSEYPVPQLTEAGTNLMKGDGEFFLRVDQRVEPQKGGTSALEVSYDQGLFEVLRIERRKIAEEESVPPYVIFGDKTLREIAAYQPCNNREFLRLHGVGTAKVEKYASHFIQVLDEYLERG